jgi:hypothetical protein
MDDRAFLKEALDELAWLQSMRAIASEDFNPFELLDIDHANAISAYFHALKKDSPAKTWFFATFEHAAIYRAMKVDPSDPASFYACAHLRLWRDVDGKALILAAHPAPGLIPEAADWLGIDAVLAWNPVDDTAYVMGDPAPQLFGGFTSPEVGAIYASPFTFLRAWTEARARFWTEWTSAQGLAWRAAPVERDQVPGTLMLGGINDIAWVPSALPHDLTCVGLDSSKINKAIIKAAKLPFAVNGMRAAA